MKFIKRKTHAILDYIMGILLIASPWIFNFAANDSAKWTVIIIGIVMLLTSLVTDYEGGLIKKLSMGAHLSLDTIAGILLAVSPWVFGFHDQVFMPHLILGLLEIGAAICTQSTSQHAHAARPGNIRRESY